jgi:hypothetical protein
MNSSFFYNRMRVDSKVEIVYSSWKTNTTNGPSIYYKVDGCNVGLVYYECVPVLLSRGFWVDDLDTYWQI